MKYFQAYCYLIFALLFLVLTIGLSFFYSQSQPLAVFLAQVQNSLHQEINQSQEALKTLKKKLSSESTIEINFQKILQEQQYPIFIYKDDVLCFWTENRYQIGSEMIMGKLTPQCIENNHGIFLINKELLIVEKKQQERYTLIAVVPLYLKAKDNRYLQSALNPKIFEQAQLQLGLEPDKAHAIKDSEGRYLFSVILPQKTKEIRTERGGIIYQLMLLSAFLVSMFTFLQIKQNLLEYIQRRKVGQGFFMLFIYILLIRLLMLYFKIPFVLIDSELFSNKYYLSNIAPSLGDLFLNILSFTILAAYIFFYYPKIFNFKRLFSLNSLQKRLLSVLLVFWSFVIFWLQFYVLESIYFDSSVTLDITTDIKFTVFKITCFAVFLLNALLYFFNSHVIARLLIAFHKTNWEIGINLLLASGFFIGLFALLGRFDAMVFMLNLLYLSLISLVGFPKTVQYFKYFTYLYFVLSTIISAALGAYSIYIFEKTLDIQNKNIFAGDLLIENDQHGEVLLSKAIKEVQNDPMILNRLTSSALVGKDLVIQKIKSFHLNNYFDKYDVSVFLFNEAGYPLNFGQTYDSLEQRYRQKKYKTEHPDIFFIKDLAGNDKHYIVFLELQRRGVPIGKIILDLKLKKIIPNSVYPNLFLDKKFTNIYDDTDISYAIYRNGKLSYSYGDFSYEKDFYHYFPQNHSEKRTELVQGQHRHLMIRGENYRDIIITSSFSPARSISSNFSFLFILLFFFKILLFISYYIYIRNFSLKLTFSARIQVYLNLAFSIPIFLIGVLIISILNSENRNATKDNYFQKAENVGANIVSDLEKYKKALLSEEDLQNQIIKASKLVQTDINLFDRNGVLLVSNQPFIYESDFLSKLVNPIAMQEIGEKGQGKIMLVESVGTLEYNSVYAAIKSYETGELLGIVGIPFFESQKNSEKAIIEILTTIINVFTMAFILLIGLSYIASQFLTKPLEMITQRINITSLSKLNEPLDYQSDDEIGILVGAYNKMLVQLEESKQALSKNEKESAWREMARQVAHEIKNPLTPMKLTLQHLKRLLSDHPRAEKSVETLLVQIETLSDIATSFSSFANMPIPKNEEFDIVQVLQQTTVLYKNDEKAQINVDIRQESCLVLGDKNLMGRIFTNLILNGIQAVPNSKLPVIDIILQKVQDKVLIEIRDNGSGIDEEIIHKVFLPNFSTKFTGSGIGLALAKRGIEHAGGKIWFETQKDIGTSFFIEMPILKS